MRQYKTNADSTCGYHVLLGRVNTERAKRNKQNNIITFGFLYTPVIKINFDEDNAVIPLLWQFLLNCEINDNK